MDSLHAEARRPVIGVVPSRDGERAMLKFEYFNAVWQAGGLPVALAYTADPEKLAAYAATCDGFLFSGGDDIHPSKYGEEIGFDNVVCDTRRDEFEEGLFAAVYPTGKPILGICRGIQSINVWMGGTLHQDIGGHRQTESGGSCTHAVEIREGSMFRALCGRDTVMVNSFHHQAVKDLAPKLVVDAVSEDGVVEAFHLPASEHPFLFAVQFHPECYCALADDDHAAAIFAAFVAACGQ